MQHPRIFIQGHIGQGRTNIALLYNLWDRGGFTDVRTVYTEHDMCIVHRVHIVVNAAFWHTFHHEGEISPGWRGCGVHGHPLSLHLPSPVKLQCTLQLSGQIHLPPCFISSKNLYSVVLCTGLWGGGGGGEKIA